jgi:hypothetical protein
VHFLLCLVTNIPWVIASPALSLRSWPALEEKSPDGIGLSFNDLDGSSPAINSSECEKIFFIYTYKVDSHY